MIAFRPIEDGEVERLVELWKACDLVRPWNDARRDIDFARGKANSEILIGIEAGEIVSSILVGHDGHRGWFYYLSVAPARQGKGLGRATVSAAETWLKERGVWSVNLMIRTENAAVRDFYAALGYDMRDVIVMGKRDLDR
ncbi:GNAT family acetyltransferase [Nordella sp. HKS 07]|uniref:GNAT family acetyltransferase n=1 Tax=Nordella sp. HKS 07 TaxID=2712222 RepID=UPI0013E14593|nr:GNAT family acetyltransferase [Nordella sp. HKS 07]QIG49526.1 GNAT family acetyltransferase [Nordella sp. HKS 07]